MQLPLPRIHEDDGASPGGSEEEEERGRAAIRGNRYGGAMMGQQVKRDESDDLDLSGRGSGGSAGGEEERMVDD